MQELTQESVAAPSSVIASEHPDNVHQNPLMRILAIAVTLVLLALGISALFDGGTGTSAGAARVWPATAAERRIERKAIVERDAALDAWVADQKVREEKLLNFYTEVTRQIQARAAAEAAAKARAEAARKQAESRKLSSQAVSRAPATTGPGSPWDGVARCETGSDWGMIGSTYSGGLGFYNGTWTGWGGRDFAPNAGMATREQQIVIANRVAWSGYAGNPARNEPPQKPVGLSGWGCRDYYGK